MIRSNLSYLMKSGQNCRNTRVKVFHLTTLQLSVSESLNMTLKVIYVCIGDEGSMCLLLSGAKRNQIELLTPCAKRPHFRSGTFFSNL